MPSPAEHYLLAEAYLKDAVRARGSHLAAFLTDMAQVHATLATAAPEPQVQYYRVGCDRSGDATHVWEAGA